MPQLCEIITHAFLVHFDVIFILFLCADDTYKAQKYVTQFENYWFNHRSGEEQKGKIKNAETKAWITKSVHLSSKKWEAVIVETFPSTVMLTPDTRKQIKAATR